jgi:hypothetical protein
MSERFALFETLSEPTERGSRGLEGRGDLSWNAYQAIWFIAIGLNEAWVAVTESSGGGGGWFRTDASLDPRSRGWDPVDAGEVLDFVQDGADQTAVLTAEMLSSCIRDGFGSCAMSLADVLIDHGYSLRVSVER